MEEILRSNMKLYIKHIGSLGDLLNSLPVLSGLNKKIGKFDLVIKHELTQFKGIREFFLYQDLFDNVYLDNEINIDYNVVQLDIWNCRHTVNSDIRPHETCKYENWIRDNLNPDFEVDDDFEIKFPHCDIEVKDNYYVGDRWAGQFTDRRRECNILTYLSDFEFIDYNNDILTNCYIIKNSTKPFITNLTGVSVIADLLNKETFIVWKPEDWKPEYRNGNDVSWDNCNIDKVFEKHFYKNRKSKMVHATELERLL